MGSVYQLLPPFPFVNKCSLLLNIVTMYLVQAVMECQFSPAVLLQHQFCLMLFSACSAGKEFPCIPIRMIWAIFFEASFRNKTKRVVWDWSEGYSLHVNYLWNILDFVKVKIELVSVLNGILYITKCKFSLLFCLSMKWSIGDYHLDT